MNFLTLALAAAATLLLPSSSDQRLEQSQSEVGQSKDVSLQTNVEVVAAPDMLFVPAVFTQAEGPEKLLAEIGQDGPLGDTCWSHQNGEIAFSGIIKPDGTIVYDEAPDMTRCPSMD